MKQFNRQYKIFLGGELMIDGTQENAPQITFTVENIFGGGVSYAEITISNLNRESRRKLLTRKEREKYQDIDFWAGYEDNCSAIFKGVIRNAFKNTPDAKTQNITLYCRGSGIEFENKSFSKTWGKDTPYEQIIRETAQQFGLPVVVNGDFSTLPKAIMGATLSTDVKSALTGLAEQFDFKWQIENRKVVLIKDGFTRGTRFKYDQSNLLVGGTEVTEVGANVTVKLNPALTPYTVLEIESESPVASYSGVYDRDLPDTVGKGKYTIYQVTHTGDFCGKTWDTKNQCLRSK